VAKSYGDAIQHLRRADETEDALTSANSAVEAALKAVGMKGRTLSALMADFRRSGIVKGFSPDTLANITKLISQIEAWRSQQGDAHGKAPGAEDGTASARCARSPLGWRLHRLFERGHRVAVGVIPSEPITNREATARFKGALIGSRRSVAVEHGARLPASLPHQVTLGPAIA
jgi:hypothetical protein